MLFIKCRKHRKYILEKRLKLRTVVVNIPKLLLVNIHTVIRTIIFIKHITEDKAHTSRRNSLTTVYYNVNTSFKPSSMH